MSTEREGVPSLVGRPILGDEAVQPQLPGLVDHSHPAPAQFLEYLIARGMPVDRRLVIERDRPGGDHGQPRGRAGRAVEELIDGFELGDSKPQGLDQLGLPRTQFLDREAVPLGLGFLPAQK